MRPKLRGNKNMIDCLANMRRLRAHADICKIASWELLWVSVDV